MRRLVGATVAIHLIAALTLTLSGCGAEPSSGRDLSAFDSDYQQVLMEALLDAKPGDVIEVPAGRFLIERSLDLRASGVTIRGAGMNQSILSFARQRQGAEGLLVSGADDFTLEHLAIEDTKGDAVKITDGTNIIVRNVRVEWTNGPDTKNGAYGIYPVQVTNVLVENSVAIGASDAGIYVGQSDQIVVRDNRAAYNVAGIEIENSNNADVYRNIATNNTGGILVFNMPNLPRPGAHTRVFDNDVFANNTPNFGHPGTPVASVRAGSGVVVNSNDHVEIFGNRFQNNQTANVIISSLYSANFSDESATPDFDPYPEAIHIHGNHYEGGGNSPDGDELKQLRVALFGETGRLPDVLFDGYVDRAKFVNGAQPDALRICVTDAEVLNADAPNGYASPRVEGEAHACELPPLSPVKLPLG